MTDVFSCRTQTTKRVTRTRHYMTAKVRMDRQDAYMLCVHYLAKRGDICDKPFIMY